VDRLRVVPIVEGHGEFHAIRTLLQRVWLEIVGGQYIDVIRPIRQPRNKLVRDDDSLKRAIELAVLKLSECGADIPGMVLLLVDADQDAVCQLAPQLLATSRLINANTDMACILANVEYETWFVAAAESLQEYLDLQPNDPPAFPENTRSGKAWVEKRFKGIKYSETVDQPAMTAALDLQQCRSRSPSFDKLCRELERRFAAP
jgi:hypothetical protein